MRQKPSMCRFLVSKYDAKKFSVLHASFYLAKKNTILARQRIAHLTQV